MSWHVSVMVFAALLVIWIGSDAQAGFLTGDLRSSERLAETVTYDPGQPPLIRQVSEEPSPEKPAPSKIWPFCLLHASVPLNSGGTGGALGGSSSSPGPLIVETDRQDDRTDELIIWLPARERVWLPASPAAAIFHPPRG
jgi:hypothetical protein